MRCCFCSTEMDKIGKGHYACMKCSQEEIIVTTKKEKKKIEWNKNIKISKFHLVAMIIILILTCVVFMMEISEMKATHKEELRFYTTMSIKLTNDLDHADSYNDLMSMLVDRQSVKLKDLSDAYNRTDFVTQSEVVMLQRMIEAEATGGSLQAMVDVGSVMRERKEHERFDNDYEGVLFAPRQFSPVYDGRYYSVEVTETAELATDLILRGNYTNIGALYFMNRSGSDSSNVTWFDQKLQFLMKRHGHEFFGYR